MPHVQREFFGPPPHKAAPCPRPSAKPKPAEKPKRRMPPNVVRWLTRMTRIQAHMSYIVRLFKHPEIAGGQSLEGETYQDRAARCDQTLIHDACLLGRDEFDSIVAEVQSAMDAAPPTLAKPGTKAKVDEMEARAMRGQSIFIDRDAKIG